LRVSEKEAWKALEGYRTGSPYFVIGNEIYFTDSYLSQAEFFREMTTGEVKLAEISNTTENGARIIGRMLYQAIDAYLSSRNFENIGGRAYESIYIISDDPAYAMKKQGGGEGTYVAYRGIGPKVYAAPAPGVVKILFETRSKFKIYVPLHAWSKWINHPVVVNRKNKSYRGLTILKSVSEEYGIIESPDGKFRDKIPLKELYVPARPATLKKRGVYEDMLRFAQFRDNEEDIDSSFKFLERNFHRILNNDSFSITLDGGGKKLLSFRRVNFASRGVDYNTR
jgi:hypothetical protein